MSGYRLLNVNDLVVRFPAPDQASWVSISVGCMPSMVCR